MTAVLRAQTRSSPWQTSPQSGYARARCRMGGRVSRRARGSRKGAAVEVGAGMADIGEGKLAALFRSARGLPAVARISFEGNQIVAGGVLRTAIAQAGIGSPYTEHHSARSWSPPSALFSRRAGVCASHSKDPHRRGRRHQRHPRDCHCGRRRSIHAERCQYRETQPAARSRITSRGGYQDRQYCKFDLIAAGLERVKTAVIARATSTLRYRSTASSTTPGRPPT